MGTKDVTGARCRRMAQLAAASLLVVLAGCSSSPAEQERDKDAQYVETVQDGSVVLRAISPQQLVAYGRQHCDYAHNGVPRYVAQVHTQATQGMTPQDTTLLIDTAREVYCPDMVGRQ